LAQSNVSRERQYAIKWLKRLPNDPGFVYRKFIVDRVDEAIFDISSSISDFETGGALHRRALRDIPETPPHRGPRRFRGFLGDRGAEIIGHPIEVVMDDLLAARRALRYIGKQAIP